MQVSFASELAGTIHNLGSNAASADFGTFLTALGWRLRDALENAGIADAAQIAADAITIACHRDGVADIAQRAMSAAK